jgi:hypothetical protein
VSGSATEVPPDADACTRALVRGIDARVESPTGHALADEAATAAEHCGDDRLLFDALVARAGYEDNLFSSDPRLPLRVAITCKPASRGPARARR